MTRFVFIPVASNLVPLKVCSGPVEKQFVYGAIFFRGFVDHHYDYKLEQKRERAYCKKCDTFYTVNVTQCKCYNPVPDEWRVQRFKRFLEEMKKRSTENK